MPYQTTPRYRAVDCWDPALPASCRGGTYWGVLYWHAWFGEESLLVSGMRKDVARHVAAALNLSVAVYPEVVLAELESMSSLGLERLAVAADRDAERLSIIARELDSPELTKEAQHTHDVAAVVYRHATGRQLPSCARVEPVHQSEPS